MTDDVELYEATKEEVGYEGPTTQIEEGEKMIKGTNPQNLFEKILRQKIYNSHYYKEHCFGLTAETLIDKAAELDGVGGTYGGNRKPSNFLCLAFKLVQIHPEFEIIQEYINAEQFKYLRVLAAFYVRITCNSVTVYKTLEPLLKDYRKIRRKKNDGKYEIIHIDEFIEELLTKNYACDIALPFLQKRVNLEKEGKLKPRETEIKPEELTDEEKEEERERSYKLTFKRQLKTAEEEEAEIEAEVERRLREKREREEDMYKPTEKEMEMANRRTYDSYYYNSRERQSALDEEYRRMQWQKEVERERERVLRERRKREKRKDKRKYDERERREKKSSGEISMSIEETNEMRKKLGLKPLK